MQYLERPVNISKDRPLLTKNLKGWFSPVAEFFQSKPVLTTLHWFAYAGTRFAAGYVFFKVIEHFGPHPLSGPQDPQDPPETME